MKFKFNMRDLIALLVLGVGFYFIYLGIDGWLQGVMALIIGYYFSKRIYEENHEEIPLVMK